MISSSLNELTWRETTCFFYILRFVFFLLFYFDWISDADNTPEMDTDTGDIKGHKIRYTLLLFYYYTDRTQTRHLRNNCHFKTSTDANTNSLPPQKSPPPHKKRQIWRINGQANPRSHFLTLSNISHKFTKKKRNKYKIKFRRQRRINVKKG